MSNTVLIVKLNSFALSASLRATIGIQMSNVVLKPENICKHYRLGHLRTTAISHDLNVNLIGISTRKIEENIAKLKKLEFQPLGANKGGYWNFEQWKTWQCTVKKEWVC